METSRPDNFVLIFVSSIIHYPCVLIPRTNNWSLENNHCLYFYRSQQRGVVLLLYVVESSSMVVALGIRNHLNFFSLGPQDRPLHPSKYLTTHFSWHPPNRMNLLVYYHPIILLSRDTHNLVSFPE